MSTSVSTSFVRQYERDVHDTFQREGSYLRDTVRVVEGVVGESTTFQKIGKGTATTKARHGTITPMNQDHTAITCTLSDFYAGDWVDKLDETKLNINEQQAIARGGSYALGRKVDDQISTVFDTTTQTVVSWTVTSAAAIENALIEMIQALHANDVPNDGNIFCALTTKAWAFAMKVESFSSADYVGPDGQTFRTGMSLRGRFKDWNGGKWQAITGLPGEGTNAAKVFAYHRTSVGYGIAASAGNVAGRNAVMADITWHGDRAAHFVNHMMSGGACMIDDPGVIEGNLDDTASLPTS